MKIFIAAGHGADDPGAVGSGTNERDETIKIVNGVPPILAKIAPSTAEIVVVPNDLKLEGEVSYINSNYTNLSEDICLEVHLNSNAGDPGTGTETYYGYQPLAETMQKVMVQILGLPNRLVKAGNQFYFNKMTKPASAILELGFINNAADLVRVQQRGADAVALGIAEYFGWSKTVTVPVTPTAIDWEAKYKDTVAKAGDIRLKLLAVLNDWSL